MPSISAFKYFPTVLQTILFLSKVGLNVSKCQMLEPTICEIGPNPKIIFCRSALIFTPDLINKDVRLEIYQQF